MYLCKSFILFLWGKVLLKHIIPVQICCSLLVPMSVGRGSEGDLAPLSFEIWQFSIKFLLKKVAFLLWRGQKKISPLLALPWKNIFGCHWKNQFWPFSGKNSSDAHACINSSKHCAWDAVQKQDLWEKFYQGYKEWYRAPSKLL